MSTWVTGIVGGSLGIAVIFAFGAALYADARLRAAAPGPGWSITSWASNLTGIGAVLGSIVAGVALTAKAKPLDQDTFLALSAFFAFLVVAGPFVFQCARNPKTDPRDQGPCGWNFTLLVACSVTLAAVVGELTTLAILYWEIFDGGAPGYIAVVVVALAGLLAAYYYAVTVPKLASTKWGKLYVRALKSGESPPGWNLL